MSASTRTRHDRGTRTAGVSMGGKFALSARTEAGGFALASSNPSQHSDATALQAQAILDAAGIIGVDVEGRGDDVVLSVGPSTQANASDILTYESRLTDAEKTEGIVSRAENLQHQERVGYIGNLRGSFTPELEKMRQGEILELNARIAHFEEQSRWAEDNWIGIKSMHVITSEPIGMHGRYSESAMQIGSEQQSMENPFGYAQELSVGAPPLTSDTLSAYRPEIEYFLGEQFGAEVTLNLGLGMMTARRYVEGKGALHEGRVEQFRNSAMHAAGTEDNLLDDELFEFLKSHAKIPAEDISNARDDWEKVENIGSRVNEIGAKMRPADWAVALQSTVPKLSSSKSDRPVREFVNQGLLSPDLGPALARMCQAEREGSDFYVVASELRKRLAEDRPLIARPAPEWDR